MRNGFSTLIQVVQDDFGYDLGFQLQDSQGIIVDLTGATLVFSCQTDSDYPIQFQNAMAIVSATGGTCKYTVKNTDFVVSGTWQAQIIVSYGSGETISFEGIEISVVARVPIS